MAGIEATQLDSGDPFPEMEILTTDNEVLLLPQAFAGRWAVILLYRGDW